MLYKYQAKTKDGLKQRTGEIEAPSQSAARQTLQANGLIVYSLVPARSQNSIRDFIANLMGVSITDLVRFTEQLASMIAASLPLTQALSLLSTQTKNPILVEVIKSTLADIESGKPLSFSLSQRPDIFSDSYISLVRAGEASGGLGNMLKRLSITLEKQRVFRAKVKSALIYPTIVLTVMIGVFVLVMLFVVPQMAGMYESLDVELPFATVALIAISEFSQNFWYIILIGVIILAIVMKFFKETESGAYAFADAALRMPIFGSLNKQAGMVNFCGTLALLLEAGVPILEALRIVKNSADNLYFRDAIERMVDEIKKGFPLSNALSKEEIFPPLVGQMVIVGEQTGTVSDRLKSLGDYYEGEVDKIVKNLSTLMEPFIIVMLGILVALLMFAVITPLYQLIASF